MLFFKKSLLFFCFLVIKISLFSQLVEVVKEISDVVLDIKYSTTDNFTEKKIYSSAKCFLQKECVDALKHVQEELKKLGLGLKVWDGYRPFFVQEIFWQIIPDDRFVAKPVREKDKLIKGSKHNRGTAVDLTLINLNTKQELKMPSGFDEFTVLANRVYERMGKEEKENCLLLENLMKKYGFISIYDEWWHFDWNNWQNFALLDIGLDQIN